MPFGWSALLLRDAADGPVVAEVSEHGPQRSLSLRPGRYFVRVRGDEVLYEGPLRAAAGTSQTLDLARLTRLEYARLVRKGPGAPRWSHALELGARLQSALQNADAPCLGGFVGYALDAARLGARARLSACASDWDNPHVHAVARAYALDLRLHHAWDAAAFTFELGLGGGVSLLTQDLEARGRAPARRTLAPFLALGAGVLWDLSWQALYLSFDLAAETHFVRMQDDALSPVERTAQLALRTALGLGRHF